MCLILTYLVSCYFIFFLNVLKYNCTSKKWNLKKLYIKASKSQTRKKYSSQQDRLESEENLGM